LVADFARRVWDLADEAQSHHRRAAARHDRDGLRRIAEAHADLTRFVESLEATVADADRSTPTRR
jgi:hypothetical protein